MDIFNTLYDLNNQLSEDEMWVTILENAFYERDVTNLEELIALAVEEGDDDAIYQLVDEGESLLLLRNQALEEWFNEDGDDDYDENDDWQ